MQTLKIVKQKKGANAVKPTNIYTDTHEKLISVSNESGIPIVKLISLMVDFAMENMVIVDQEDQPNDDGKGA